MRERKGRDPLPENYNDTPPMEDLPADYERSIDLGIIDQTWRVVTQGMAIAEGDQARSEGRHVMPGYSSCRYPNFLDTIKYERNRPNRYPSGWWRYYEITPLFDQVAEHLPVSRPGARELINQHRDT